MERMFFWPTNPPKKKASPGVIKSTNAELSNIQAVSPVSIFDGVETEADVCIWVWTAPVSASSAKLKTG